MSNSFGLLQEADPPPSYHGACPGENGNEGRDLHGTVHLRSAKGEAPMRIAPEHKRVENAKADEAAYLFTFAEAVLIDRRSGREIWNVKGYNNNAWHRVQVRAE